VHLDEGGQLTSGEEDEFDPHSMWSEARALGDEPGLEWTFPILLYRALALKPEHGGRPTGIDLHYEPLSTWDETVGALQLNDALLENSDIPPTLAYNVSVGLELFDGVYRTVDGHLRLPHLAEPFRGRHFVSLVGLTEARPPLIDPELVFRNSWGDRWGDSGFGYVDRRYFEAHTDSVWLTRAAWVGPSLPMDRTMKERSWAEGRGGAVVAADVINTWLTLNEVLVSNVVVREQAYQLRRRVTFSAGEGCYRFEIIDIRLPSGPICGRCHIRFDDSRAVTEIQELFVTPAMRRKGIGGELLARALSRAKSLRSEYAELIVHEADAGPGLTRAITFGSSCGVAWENRSTRRPMISNLGRLTLA
jgi:GNAT superfamily N-acetyltransferase